MGLAVTRADETTSRVTVDRQSVELTGDLTNALPTRYRINKAKKAYKAIHPSCEFCGRSKTYGTHQSIQAHHLIPENTKFEIAAAITNFISACASCHHTFCHAGDTKFYNPYAREFADELQRIRSDTNYFLKVANKPEKKRRRKRRRHHRDR